MTIDDDFSPHLIRHLNRLPRHRKILIALGAERPRIERAFRAAQVEAYGLRARLRELELHMRQALAVLESAGTRYPWPPLPDPIRPPTLHEAIGIVLESHHNRWMRMDDLAREIAGRALYRRRDGLAATPRDVSARISAYRELFERDGYVARLRGHQSGQP
jgi:hypothetical protein